MKSFIITLFFICCTSCTQTEVSWQWTQHQINCLESIAAKPWPPTGPWHHEAHAFANLCTNQNLEQANASILKDRQEFFGTDVLKKHDDNSFHWHAYLLERMYFLFSSKSQYFPGRLSKEAEEAIEAMLWTWVEARYHSEIVDPKHDWRIKGSENHHLQQWGSLWGALQLLSDHSEYQSRKLASGDTVTEAYEKFTEYFKRFFKNRLSMNNLFIECNADYQPYSLSPIYNIVDFAKDKSLKKICKIFLDHYWRIWAIEQIDGVRGGSSHRLYQGRDSIVSSGGGFPLARFHFKKFETSGRGAHPNSFCTATTFYHPNQDVVDLVNNPEKRGNYEITSRLAGLTDGHHTTDQLPQYIKGMKKTHPLYFKGGTPLFLPEEGGVTRYTYCTPDFIMGASMVEVKPYKKWAGISCQNRWNKVIFGGSKTARITAQTFRPKKRFCL